MPSIFTYLFATLLLSCANPTAPNSAAEVQTPSIVTGAENIDAYLKLLENKRVAGVFNQSSLIHDQHVVDFLLSKGIKLQKVFALEHGFRGSEDAGAKIKDDVDSKSGLPIVSLYGKKKKPTESDLKEVDVVIFDVQDVGVRFYTYISTLHYIMEACAELNIELLLLDRPNPNGHYIDGPVLKDGFQSFVGMHHVPVVYGMTIGEYGQMIKGEGWIKNAENLKLTVVPCLHYTHNTPYQLPVKPSPNLPNFRSVLLYPSLCFFEGTSVSVGRGTEKQFQCIGHPQLKFGNYTFTPRPMPGAKSPKHESLLCQGFDLSNESVEQIFNEKKLNLTHLLTMYHSLTEQDIPFFTRPDFFDLLSGSDQLRNQILDGLTEKEIKASWQSDLDDFKEVRSKYLIYD